MGLNHLHRKMSIRTAPQLVAATTLALLASCSTAFNEKYYVGVYEMRPDRKADDPKNKPTQFYRFTVQGASSLGCKTRYEAGWYDAAAVDRLFGEIKDKQVVESGTKPSAPAEVVNTIPMIFAQGGVETNEPGGLTAKNVAAKIRISPASIPLEGILEITADKVTVTVDKTTTSMAVSGLLRCKFDGGVFGPNLIKDQTTVYLDLSPTSNYTDNSVIVCDDLNALHASGGQFTVTTPDPESKSFSWIGANKEAISKSAFHDFLWTGGQFTILDGQVTRGFDNLQANQSIGRFDDSKNGKIKLTAKSGWLAQLLNAKIDLTGEVEAEGKIEGQAVCTLGQDQRLRVAQEAYRDRLEKLLLAKDGKPTEFESATFRVVVPDKKDPRENEKNDKPVKAKFDRPPGGPSDGPSIAVNKFTTTKLTVVDQGTWQITSTGAVEGARDHNKIVVIKDPNRQIFMKFGPEGRGTAQRDDERFVIFMTSNPGVLIGRIKALVNSRTAQAVVANAIFGPRMEEERRKVDTADQDLTQASALAQQMKTAVTADNFNALNADQLKALAIQWMSAADAGDPGIASLLHLGGK